MIVVIQCASTKRKDAGHFETSDGRRVEFVAYPDAAPASLQQVYVKPDDISDDGGGTWRSRLLDYNKRLHGNPFALLPACRLYENRVYGELVERFGTANVYILSAGWGLIRADFLTPSYDITFSINADHYKRRRKTDCYDDLCMLPARDTENIVFLGGKDYLPLFCALTEKHQACRIVFYNSNNIPRLNGCTLRRYETTTRTNWHYECAGALLRGELKVP